MPAGRWAREHCNSAGKFVVVFEEIPKFLEGHVQTPVMEPRTLTVLLPKIISGEIRVNDTEWFLGEHGL